MSVHAESLKDRVARVLAEQLAPALAMDETMIEVIEVIDGVTRIRLGGACGCYPSSVMVIIVGIEQEMRRRVPEIEYLEIVP